MDTARVVIADNVGTGMLVMMMACWPNVELMAGSIGVDDVTPLVLHGQSSISHDACDDQCIMRVEDLSSVEGRPRPECQSCDCNKKKPRVKSRQH